jgi:hypothetical protein
MIESKSETIKTPVVTKQPPKPTITKYQLDEARNRIKNEFDKLKGGT